MWKFIRQIITLIWNILFVFLKKAGQKIFLQEKLNVRVVMALNSKAAVCLLAVVLCTMFGACDSGPGGDTFEVGKVKYITSFPEKIDLKGKEIELAPPSYGCAWIENIIDTTIILVDVGSTNGYFFYAYSTPSNKYLGSFINNGRGPGEYSAAPHLINTGKSDAVCVADVYTGETVYKNLDSLIKYGKSAGIYKLPSPVVNGGLNTLEYMNDSVRILRRLYFSKGNKIKVSYNVFKDTVPLREIPVFDFTDSPQATDLSMLAMSTCIPPDGKMIFCALCHFNQINVYSLSGEEEFTICVSKERKLYTQQDYNNTSKITRRYFYDGVTCSDKYLFALYYDLPAIKHETEQDAYPVIQIFTFNGDPVAELTVQDQLIDIVFDPVHNRMYAFTRDGRFLYYDLQGTGL